MEENIMAFTIDKIRRVTAYAAAPRTAAENHGVAINNDDILYTIKDVSGFSISNSAETVWMEVLKVCGFTF